MSVLCPVRITICSAPGKYKKIGETFSLGNFYFYGAKKWIERHETPMKIIEEHVHLNKKKWTVDGQCTNEIKKKNMEVPHFLRKKIAKCPFF